MSATGKIWIFPANLTPYFKIVIIIISVETTFFLEQEQKKKFDWEVGVEEIKLFQATLPTFWDCLKKICIIKN